MTEHREAKSSSEEDTDDKDNCDSGDNDLGMHVNQIESVWNWQVRHCTQVELSTKHLNIIIK